MSVSLHSFFYLELTHLRPDGTHFHMEKPTQQTITPRRGDVITFTYDNYSRRAAPVNPKLLSIRHDLPPWDHLLALSQESPSLSQVPVENSTIPAHVFIVCCSDIIRRTTLSVCHQASKVLDFRQEEEHEIVP